MSEVDPVLEQELERFCAQARKRRARAVILFGSRARGQHTEASDVDICLIAEDLPEELLQRRYPTPLGYRSLSVFGFHPEEFLRLLREGNPFVLDIMHDGIVVYEDGFMQRAQAAYREAIQRYGLRRVRGGWDWEIGTRHR